MQEDQFTKLFTYMQDEFANLREEINHVRSDVQRVYGVVDAIKKEKETDHQERLMMTHQVDRHQDWIEQLAKKTDVKLRYE